MNDEMKKLTSKAAGIQGELSTLRVEFNNVTHDCQLHIDELKKQMRLADTIQRNSKAAYAEAGDILYSYHLGDDDGKSDRPMTFEELLANVEAGEFAVAEFEVMLSTLQHDADVALSRAKAPRKSKRPLSLSDADLARLPFGVPTLSSKVRNATRAWRRVLEAPVDQREAFLLSHNVRCERVQGSSALFLTRQEF